MNAKIATLIFALVLAPSFVLAASPDGNYGAAADRLATFRQGQTWNSQPVPPTRSNPLAALGRPETLGNSARCDTAADSDFVSLGYGGSITLLFYNYIVNGSQEDLSLFEYNGCSDQFAIETVRVQASQNGTNWTNLGFVTHDGRVDLGPLPWAKYIRLSDVSNPGQAPDQDGYDLDAIMALHSSPTQP